MNKLLKLLLVLIIAIVIIQSVFNLFFLKKDFISSICISESKEIGAFIVNYKITDLSSSVNDSLLKYNVLDKVKNIEMWVERFSTYDSKYIFFYPIKYGEGKDIIYIDPLLGTCDDYEKYKNQISERKIPEIGLVMEEDSFPSYGPFRRIHHYDIKHLYGELTFNLYFYWDSHIVSQSEAVYIGQVTAKRQEYMGENKHKDPKSLFSRFYIFPFLYINQIDNPARRCNTWCEYPPVTGIKND